MCHALRHSFCDCSSRWTRIKVTNSFIFDMFYTSFKFIFCLHTAERSDTQASGFTLFFINEELKMSN